MSTLLGMNDYKVAIEHLANYKAVQRTVAAYCLVVDGNAKHPVTPGMD